MIQLRDYQIDMIERTREALKTNQCVVLQAPTGAGKTVVAAYMLEQAKKRGLTAMFLVHQNELIKQTSTSLWNYKIEHGFIVSGRGRSPAPIQVASVMTLKNRLDQYDEPSLIIIDESHRALAASYLKIVEAYPNAKVVGLTATPQRTDGRGLGHLFQHIVKGPSISYLTQIGSLCDYELFGVPQKIDMSSVKNKLGDYAADDLEREVNKPTITGDAIEHWRALANGLVTVVMCVSIKHAEDVAAQFSAAGIPAEAIHGKTKNRDDVLERFESGVTTVLTSVQLLVEGYDHPAIAAVVWLRPTQSLSVFMQGNGRGLRPHHSKRHLTIIDHVGNFSRHGLPCADREWSLDDRSKNKKSSSSEDPDVGVQVCGECFFTVKTGLTECPKCGAEIELKTRTIEQVDGELERIKAAAVEHKKQERIEQGKSKTLEELVANGIARKMKNPSAWSANVFAARQGRKASAADYSAAKRIMVGMQ